MLSWRSWWFLQALVIWVILSFHILPVAVGPVTSDLQNNIRKLLVSPLLVPGSCQLFCCWPDFILCSPVNISSANLRKPTPDHSIVSMSSPTIFSKLLEFSTSTSPFSLPYQSVPPLDCFYFASLFGLPFVNSHRAQFLLSTALPHTDMEEPPLVSHSFLTSSVPPPHYWSWFFKNKYPMT